MPTVDTELRTPNKLPDIFRTINGINFDIGPLDRLRDSDSKPEATQWGSGSGEREKAVNSDRKNFPRIILRDALGHELDTFTTLQEAIYRAKWNVKQTGQAKEPLEWRLPKAPPPARPDLTRTFPPLKHPPVQQNEAQTRSKWDHSRVLEFDVEDVGFVRESLQYLPYAPSLSFLRQEILVGPKMYFQIVGTMLLHKRFLSHTEKRQAIYNFPGFCTGCIRMGLCYGCERGTELHFHEDKPVKTGGGFTYFKKDRPENEIKSRNPINWKIHQPDKALKRLMEEYAGVELEGPIPDEIKRHLDKHGGRREKIVSNIPDFAKEMQEMAEKENRRRDRTSSDFRVRYGAESDLEDDLEGKGQGQIDPSDVRLSMNGEGQGDMEGGEGAYRGQQGYTDGSEMEQHGTGEGTWRNRYPTSDDENRDASYDRDGHRLPKYRRVESDEDNAGDEETDTEIPYGHQSRRKEKLYKAPPPFKLKKSPKRSIVSQSPFSTDRKYDLPKGKGLDIKKSDKPPTEFKEFRNVDVSWKEPKKFELKKVDQKTTKFWSGPPKKKKEKKKAETDEHEEGHGSRRVRSPSERSPRSVSPDSGHDSEFQTVVKKPESPQLPQVQFPSKTDKVDFMDNTCVLVKTSSKISKRRSRKPRNKKKKNNFISDGTDSKTDGQTTKMRDESMCNLKTRFPKISSCHNPKSEGDSHTLNGSKKNNGYNVEEITDNDFDDHKNIPGMKLSTNENSLDGYYDTAAEYYKDFDIQEYQRRSRSQSQDISREARTIPPHPRHKGVRKATVQRTRSPEPQNLVLYKPRSSTISPILYQGASHDQNHDQSGVEDNWEDSEEDVKRLMEGNITLSDLESNASARRRLGSMSTRLQSRSTGPGKEADMLETSQATPFKGFRGHHTLVAKGTTHKRGPVSKAIEFNNEKTLEGSIKKKMETINMLPGIVGQKTDAESPVSHDPRQNKHQVTTDPVQWGSLSLQNRATSGTNGSVQAPGSQTDTPSSIGNSTRTAGMTLTPISRSRSRSRSFVKEYQAIYQRQHSGRADSLPLIIGHDNQKQNSLSRHRTVDKCSSIQETVESHSERNDTYEPHAHDNARSDPRDSKALERKTKVELVPTEADDDSKNEVIQWNQEQFHKVPTGRRESFLSNAQSHFTGSYVDHNFSSDGHLEKGLQSIDKIILEADQENEHASDEVNVLVEKSKENEYEKCYSNKFFPPLISSYIENDKGSLTSQEPDLELVFDDLIDVANLEVVEYEEPALDWDELIKKERRRKHKHRKNKKNRKEADTDDRNDGDTENKEEGILQHGNQIENIKGKESAGLEEQDSVPTEIVDGDSGVGKISKRRKASMQSALSERDHSLEKNIKKGKQKTKKTKVTLETTENGSSDVDEDVLVGEDIDNLNKRQNEKEKRKKRNSRDVGRDSSLNMKNNSSVDRIEEGSRERKKGQLSRDRSKEKSKHNREDSSVGRKEEGSRDKKKSQQRRERSKEKFKCSRESSSVGRKDKGSQDRKKGQQSRDRSTEISKYDWEDSSVGRNEKGSRGRKSGQQSRERSLEINKEDEFNKKDGRKTRSKERSGGERKLKKKNTRRGKGSVHRIKNEEVEHISEGEIDFNELPSIKSQLAKLFPNIQRKTEGAHGDRSNEKIDEIGETGNENNENESGEELTADTDNLTDFKYKISRPKSDEMKKFMEVSGNAWRRVRSMSMPLLQDLEEFQRRMGIPSLEDLKRPIIVPVYLPAFKQGRIIVKKQFKSNPKRVKGRERRSMSLAVVTFRPLFDPKDTTIKSELEPVREETITVTPEPDMGLSERTGTPLQLRVTSPTARNNKSKSCKKGKSGKNKKVKFKIETDDAENKTNNSSSDTDKVKDILAKTESDSMLPNKNTLLNDNTLLKKSKVKDILGSHTFGGFNEGMVYDGIAKDKAQPASVSPLPKKREIIKKEKKVKTPIPPPAPIQEQKPPTPVKEKTPSPVPVEEERPVSREISFDFVKERSLPELPPIEIPALPEIVEKQSEYKGVKKERKLIEVTPEIPEPKKKLPPPPKVAPRIKTRTTKRSKVAEAPVTSQELQQLADPLDFLAKYCIINPERLPYYERVFNGAVNIQTPRYSRDNVISRGEMVHLPPAQLSEHELNMLRDLSVITHAQTPRREGMSVPEQYLEKLNYSIEFIKMKQMALHEHMHKVQVEKMKLMAQMARELDRDIVRVDYKTKKSKKKKEEEVENTDENSPKKKKKKKKSAEPDYDSMGAMSVPKNFRPQKASDITDEVIVSRMDDKMLKKVKKDPAVKKYTLEVSRDIEKLKNFDQRIAQIEDEKDLVGLYCMDYYFKEENNSAPPYEFRRQQSRLYQKLHPNPDIEMNMEEVETALQQINNKLLSEKEFQYIYFILDLPKREKINFRLFSIVAALSEKVTQMDPVIRKLINKVDYNALDIKMEKSKELFELLQDETLPLGNAPADILAVELTAGGLTPEHTNYVLSKFNREGRGFVDFLDFVTYIPLFIEIHKRIIEDPFNENLDI